MILEKEPSPGRPLEDRGTPCRLGAGRQPGGQQIMKRGTRRPPQGERHCSHTPPPTPFLLWRSTGLLSSQPQLSLPLITNPPWMSNSLSKSSSPVMCFAGSALTSVILLPTPAPLPLLTSLLGTLLPLPWDSFTVRYQQSASCIPGLNLFLSSRKVQVSLSGCVKLTMNFPFQNGVPFQATRYSAEPLGFHLQNEDPQGSSLPITASLTSQDSAFVLECTSQSPLPLRSQCHHRQGLAQVADSLPAGFSASHPCPFAVPSADCCCWT